MSGQHQRGLVDQLGFNKLLESQHRRNRARKERRLRSSTRLLNRGAYELWALSWRGTFGGRPAPPPACPPDRLSRSAMLALRASSVPELGRFPSLVPRADGLVRALKPALRKYDCVRREDDAVGYFMGKGGDGNGTREEMRGGHAEPDLPAFPSGFS